MQSAVECLTKALERLELIDTDKSVEIIPYKKLFSHLAKLPVKVEENKLFQSDIYSSFTSCQLSEVEINR